MDPKKEIEKYYGKLESRWGYTFLLGDAKHFGYYPDKIRNIPEQKALELHQDLIAQNLSLKSGELVLDAGCGRGVTACYIAEKYDVSIMGKEGAYFEKEFSGDPWQAYKKITIRLLKDAVLAQKEILILLADYVTVPKHIHFEVDVKKEVNNLVKRLALAGVCRLDSKCNDLLQLVDLIIGAISYDLKITMGTKTGTDQYKLDFLNHLKQNLGTSDFMSGFRNRNFNIFVDKDMKRRLPLEANEKWPSS